MSRRGTGKSWLARSREKPAPLTDAQYYKLLGALETGSNQALAATVIGISERTLQYHMKGYPELLEAVEEARRIRAGHAQRSLYQIAQVGNAIEFDADGKVASAPDPRLVRCAVPAAIFILKNEAGWADKSQISGSIDVNVLPSIVEASMTPAIQARVIEQAKQLPARAEGGTSGDRY